MFNWLWEKLGGGKSSAKKDEPMDDNMSSDVGTQQQPTTDEAAAIAAEAAAASKPKGKAAAKTTTKARPKKANATRAKPSRQASASLLTSPELPAKSKKGSTTTSTARRRGSIPDFDNQYPKLLAFFDQQGHWNVPKKDTDLFAFSQSLRQHMAHVEAWETEQKKKYSTSKSAAAKNSQLALTPAQVRKLEKASFEWKSETRGGQRRRSAGSVS